ncbi:MAG: cytidylyltransferase domain-containing protein [Candidatus Heimdallarchaeota archaeon]
MNFLGLIPARSGSKGIPNKNLKLLDNKPLIYYSIEAALASKYLKQVVVSTDSQEIAESARKAEADVPFIRPLQLAQDDTPMRDVLVHAIQELTLIGRNPDILVLLQPTSPFRTTRHIDDAIEQFLAANSTCLMSVRKARENPYWMQVLKRGVLQPFLPNEPFHATRQSAPPILYPNGAIYIWKTEYLLARSQPQFPPDMISYEMDFYSSVDIDESYDWKFAEFILAQRRSS